MTQTMIENGFTQDGGSWGNEMGRRATFVVRDDLEGVGEALKDSHIQRGVDDLGRVPQKRRLHLVRPSCGSRVRKSVHGRTCIFGVC